MEPVRPIYNPGWYPVSGDDCRKQIEGFLAAYSQPGGLPDLRGGIVPHAGWKFSGAVAARVWKCLSERSDPATVILFGAVHYPGVQRNSAFTSGAWQTPLGDVEVDAALARRLVEKLGPGLISSPAAHENEHSLEVQIPFIKAFFPRARILPIAVPPRDGALELGKRIGELTRKDSVIAAGSTDLTHYGRSYGFLPAGTGAAALAWMQKNDRRMLRLMESLDAEQVQPEVAEHHNACGPGAIAATLAFARAHGKLKGTVLDYTTSFQIAPEPTFEMAVGYAGLVI